jgi:hypothetical protein
MTREYVAMLEGGVKQSPSLDVLRSLTRALKVMMGKLLESVDRPFDL